MYAYGAWMMGDLTADAGFWDIFWPRVVQGLALGLLFVPLVAVTLSQIDSRAIADATGISVLVRYLGGNVGIAILQLLQVRRAAAVAAAIAAGTTLSNPSIGPLVHAMGLERAQLYLSAATGENATVISYLYVFRLSALLFTATLPLLFFLPDPRSVRRPLPEATPPVISSAPSK